MTGKREKLVCICNCVSESEILSVLKKGAKDLEEVKRFTFATTSCGRCKGETESIVQRYFSNKPTDSQTNIVF